MLKQIIKIAKNNPETRDALLPLIVSEVRKQASAPLAIGKTYENDSLHMTRKPNKIIFWDMQNAGKTVEKITISADDALLDEVSARVKKSTYPFNVVKLYVTKSFKSKMDSGELRVSIEKGAPTPKSKSKTPNLIRLEGANIQVYAEPGKFYITNTQSRSREKIVEPPRQGAANARKAFKWLTKNKNRLQNITFSQIMYAFAKNDIDYYQY